MPILDTALAFALTMLLVATFVTWTLEALRYFSRARFKSFADMIDACTNGEFTPAVHAELKRLQASAAGELDGLLARQPAWADILPPSWTKQLHELSTADLLAKIRASAFGGELLAALGERSDRVFAAIAERYESVGRAFTASFRNRSRWWSTGIATVLAFAISIDAIEILRMYAREPASRDTVIARLDDTLADYARAERSRSAGETTPGTEGAQQAVTEAKVQLAKLTGDGWPFGWNRSPFARRGGPDAPAFGDYVSWLLGVVMTGLLAGLGGPFWFDAISGLSRSAQTVRALRLNKPAETQA